MVGMDMLIIASTATLVSLDAGLVSLIVAFLIPTATGLITRASAPAKVKQIVTMALAAAASLVTSSVVDGVAVISKETAANALLTFAIATAAYLGIYQSHNANGRLLPDFGIGGRKTAVDGALADPSEHTGA